MALCNADIVRKEGNLPSTIEEPKLTPHIEKAVWKMEDLLGEKQYDEVKRLGSDDKKLKRCTMAEANFALAFALPRLNLETDGHGIVTSTGNKENKTSLLSQNELNLIVNSFTGTAMGLIRDYIVQPDDKDDDGETDFIKGENIRIAFI